MVLKISGLLMDVPFHRKNGIGRTGFTNVNSKGM